LIVQAGAAQVRPRPATRRRAQSSQSAATSGTASTVSGLRANASPTSPCASAWTARSEPQPGQYQPVTARKGQAG
jgi:hypothetical protein